MVKIGIIDSGIDTVRLDRNKKIKGFSLKKDDQSRGIKICKDEITDEIGHGTECFNIISADNSDAQYIIVKIFQKKLVTDIDILALAINICVDHRVDIINISAGVMAKRIPEILKRACDHALKKGIIILAANHNEGYNTFPANYEKVFGVGVLEYVQGNGYRFKFGENGMEFFTSSVDRYPLNVPWSNSTSFACAKMTSLIANMLKKDRTLNAELLTKKISKFDKL